jgi:cytochrome bd-type quinol oxidase subunit 1
VNFPFWQIPEIGGSFLIALIAITHVYVSHLAVGGGLFLVLTERKAHLDGDNQLLAYVKRHTRFFLLLTMVFGGISGVGIWFIIALVQPQATSSLIHNFVFGWAIEWTFFIGEIVALLIYYYLFERLRPQVHMAIGWLYFVFAWLSLFIINGILSFMLTPGQWLETHQFWHGFFNPTFWPSTLFRTGMALTIAGIFGLVTATFSHNGDFRLALVRYCARWMLIPFIAIIVGGLWYLKAIPAQPLANMQHYNPEIFPFIRLFLWTSAIVFLGGLLSLFHLSPRLHRAIVVVILLIGLSWMGGFEYVREIARKPFVLYGQLYSNSVTPKQATEMAETGFLSQARWARHHEVTDENKREAGRDLLVHQCLICHTLGGYNDLLVRTEKFGGYGLMAQLSGQGKVNTYMPPFMGTEVEKEALAAYIAQELHGKSPDSFDPFPPVETEEKEFEIPPYEGEEAEYVILSWNDLGMHYISDSDPWFVLLPPANTIFAQLIKRGPIPRIVTSDIKIHYTVEPDFQHPENHVRFWEFAAQNFGAEISPPGGLAGKGLSGEMAPHAELAAFIAEMIPVVPYPDGGGFDPYPIFTLEAFESASGERLAMTRMVAPASSEMGCKNCHGGEWANAGVAGFTAETCRNILSSHDRMSRTDLLDRAEAGNPTICGSCHQDLALGTEGKPELLNLSAAIHGFHAGYLPDMEERSCHACHPSRSGGATRCLRGRHGDDGGGLTCIDCHGTLEDHALSLLKHEQQSGKPGAARLMANLKPVACESIDEINGRLPWINEPDCLNCHVDYELDEIDGFNHWTRESAALYRNRTGQRGVMCAACHGSPHAIYPAVNPYGEDLDNIQPLQYQDIAGTIATEHNCTVCHTSPHPIEAHHRRIFDR